MTSSLLFLYHAHGHHHSCEIGGRRSVTRIRAKLKAGTLLPPDLAIEVDATHSSIERMKIYAALRVVELWRWDNDELHVYRLRRDGTYGEVAGSLVLPELPRAKLVYFLNQRELYDDTALARRFVTWVRRHVRRGKKGPATDS